MIAALAALLLAVIPPAPTHFVTDNAHALSAETQTRLETRLEAFQKQTGDQVIVWIGQTTGSESLEQFTVDAAQKWRVGKKGKDNGAALFLFMGDHKARIEVGYGLEGVLTDARSGQIIRDTIVPLMKKGDTDAAVEGGVNAMLSTIDPSFALPSPAASSDSSSDDTGAALATLAVFLIVVGGLIFATIVTIRRRGKPHGDWMDAWMFGTAAQVAGGGSSHWYGGGFGGGGGGGGFSGGGGSFGGGGASGGW